VAGLVPTEAASHFRLRLGPVPGESGRKAIIFSPRFADRSYVLKYNARLADPAWAAVPNVSNADHGSERTVTDLDASDAARFYRVEITRP